MYISPYSATSNSFAYMLSENSVNKNKIPPNIQNKKLAGFWQIIITYRQNSLCPYLHGYCTGLQTRATHFTILKLEMSLPTATFFELKVILATKSRGRKRAPSLQKSTFVNLKRQVAQTNACRHIAFIQMQHFEVKGQLGLAEI